MIFSFVFRVVLCPYFVTGDLCSVTSDKKQTTISKLLKSICILI